MEHVTGTHAIEAWRVLRLTRAYRPPMRLCRHAIAWPCLVGVKESNRSCTARARARGAPRVLQGVEGESNLVWNTFPSSRADRCTRSQTPCEGRVKAQ